MSTSAAVVVAAAALVLSGTSPVFSAPPAIAAAVKVVKPTLKVKASYTPAANRVTSHQATLVGAADAVYSLGVPTVKVTVSKGVKKPSVPRFTTPNYGISAAHKHKFWFMDLSPGNTPGAYKVTIPVTRTDVTPNETWKLTATVFVKPYKGQSRYSTWLISGKVKASGAGTFQLRGPDYQRGATVAMYYKAKGASKYKKVATAKFDRAYQTGSKTTLTVKASHKLAAGGRYYFKVGKVKYSPAYTTAKSTL